MSSQKGNVSRARPQKYKNRTAFKNDLHDKTPQQKRCNAMHVSEVCQHCKSVVEWKIKYKKYKPLTQPRTCTRCHQRNILKAYYVLCRDCSRKDRVCAKCMRSWDEVEIEPPKPTPVEEQKLKVEMDRLIKSFPERKRRAFLRYMNRGKPSDDDKPEAAEEDENAENENGSNAEGANDADESEEKPVKRVFIPYTREELLKKIEELTLADDDEDGDDYDSEGDEDSDEDCNSNSSDEERNAESKNKSAI